MKSRPHLFREFGKDNVVEANIIVTIGLIGIEFADEAVVDQKLVIRMGTIRGENFFARSFIEGSVLLMSE